MDGCVDPAAGRTAAARRVTGSCRNFTLDGVKFRVVCRGNLEIGLESDTQVGIDNISFRIKNYISVLLWHVYPSARRKLLHKRWVGMLKS